MSEHAKFSLWSLADSFHTHQAKLLVSTPKNISEDSTRFAPVRVRGPCREVSSRTPCNAAKPLSYRWRVCRRMLNPMLLFQDRATHVAAAAAVFLSKHPARLLFSYLFAILHPNLRVTGVARIHVAQSSPRSCPIRRQAEDGILVASPNEKSERESET